MRGDGEASGCPPDWTLARYAAECSSAIDAALASWAVAKTSPCGDAVYAGYCAPSSQHLSVMWVHDFAAAESAGLVEALDAMCTGDALAEHAARWDSTFDAASVLGQLDAASSILVQWQFSAAPLAPRELLYAIVAQRRRCGEAAKGAVDADADAGGSADVFSTTTYAYASVGDEWARAALGADEWARAAGAPSRRVRSANLFPSADRVTRRADGGVRVEHIVTTRIGGWVPRVVFNRAFKAALIDASVHECAAFAAYACELAATRAKRGGEGGG